MENNDFIKRIEDLSSRCERKYEVTASSFLTPAEQQKLKRWDEFRPKNTKLVLHGGADGCERRIAFFLPEYMEPGDLEPGEYIKAIELTAYFGTPGHRDYMGALLGMGIARERLGDIAVTEKEAYVFCTPGIEKHLLGIEKVGRVTVKAKTVELSQVELPPRKSKKISFSVMSMRLDAVAAGMFGLSRTESARLISGGQVSLNYEECLKTDLQVEEGDIVSLRGHGKGIVGAPGGLSRKGRQFLEAEILI